MAWVQDEVGNWYNDDPSYTTNDNIDFGGGWNPATNTGDYGGLPTTVSGGTYGGSTDLSGITKLFKTLTGSNGTNAQVSALLPLLYGLSAASQSNTRTQPSGYQGGIPRYTATRQAPAAGQKLSGNVTYTPKAAGGGLKTGGFIVPADVVSHAGNGSSDAGLKVLAAKLGATPIKGNGDGMSDSIPTSIDGKEKALVAHEEAYISPEQVARIGGGDAKKGAKKLRDMMARIRQARTGTTAQGKQIDPNNFMPGGEVGRYADGGTTVPSSAAISSGLTGTESNLSNWAGPYVTDMLAKGQALSELPFEQYQGPLTAGPSALQTQAFNTAAGLKAPAAIGQAADTAGGIAAAAQNLRYNPVGSEFTPEYAQKYMNPYLESALTPQLAELQRQAKIAEMADMSRLTKAGAYGGGRQAVLEAENTRNLLDKVNQVTSQGYNTAYDKAMAQFNADQARKLAESQFGANYGLQGIQTGLQAAQTQGNLGLAQNQADLANLNVVAGLGGTQRGLEAEDVAAQKAQFEEARVNPYKMVQFQQSLLQGLPLAAQTYNLAPTSNLSQFASGSAAMDAVLKTLGITPAK